MVLETPQQFVFDRGEVDLLVISGPDADDFLNRLSTVNFKKNFEGSIHGAFLNGQAKLISLFTVWKNKQKSFFFIEKEMFEKTKEYLEKMHFAEDLKIETIKYFCLESRGQISSFSSEIIVEAYNWGMPGKYFFSNQKISKESISQTQYDLIRAQFGFPKPLKDITQEHILIEGPFDSFIDRDKGCYPGQEVIEKIYTYGRVARKIKKVIFENVTTQDIELLEKTLPLDLLFEEGVVGFLSSSYMDFGMATLKRHFYEKHPAIHIPLANNKILIARITETSPIT